jgi:hypothetical protein
MQPLPSTAAVTPTKKKLEKNAEEVKKKIKMNRPVLLVSLMFYLAEPHQHKQEKK